MHGMMRYLLVTLFPVRWPRPPYLLAGLVAAGLGLGAAGGYAGPNEAAVRPLTMGEMTRLEGRAQEVSRLYAGATAYVDSSVHPIASVIMNQRSDPLLAKHVAVSLVRHSNQLRLNSHLLLGMLLVENPNVNPRARSRVGAQGLMQVMPEHRGHYPCGTDLNDVDTNICYGAHVFLENLKESEGNVSSALLRYNGCVHGTNTPDCRHYPSWVYARADRVRAGNRARAGSVTR